MLVKFEQTTCWWNLNKIVWSELYKKIKNLDHFDKKCLTIFEKVLMPLWKMFLWMKQLLDAKLLIQTIIFQCSKEYSSPTQVTRLKVEPNMADPISLTEKRP